jgi:uncharacterized protein YkwD
MIRFPVLEAADYSRALTWLSAVVSLCASCAGALAQTPMTTSAVEERVLALTNEFRAQNALQPLQTEARLDDTARHFAAYVANSGNLEHDADGATPAERVKKRGYNYCIVAENLAFEYSSSGFTPDRLARNFIEGWSASPTHRANMLEPAVTQIGIGVAPSKKSGEYYAVQVFGRPMSQMINQPHECHGALRVQETHGRPRPEAGSQPRELRSGRVTRRHRDAGRSRPPEGRRPLLDRRSRAGRVSRD